jgi:thimet oligopeptidase
MEITTLPRLHLSTLLSLLLTLSGHAASAATASGDTAVSRAADGWDYAMPAAQLSALCERTLDEAKADFAAIERDTSEATLDSVFGAYDAMTLDLQAVRHVWYMSSVHPDAAYRSAAEQCMQAYTDFINDHALSPGFYQRVAAIDLSGATAAERLMVENQLRVFRQSGVDRDAKTRERVRLLMQEITALGNEFDRNIREDSRHVEARPAQLEGLPEDFIRSHPPGDDGKVRISTDYPDYYPVQKYAASDELREALYRVRQNLATPDNGPVLNALIEKRHQLATLLGYPDYASLAMDGLMMGSPGNADQFLNEVGAALRAPAARDLAQLLARLRQDEPQAEQVQAWQSTYLANLVRQEAYALDAQQVREYFHFDKVQAGIFRLTEDLFGVEIVPWETATWHPDVTSWEIREQGRPLGRFYLDMHPRDNKFKHAAHWTLRTGLRGGQLPLSGMATNFPKGLMEHNQVETFLHEFGHLLHNMFSGTARWLAVSGMSMERDFVEAPSQMLEEWVWDYDTLRTFASNEAGETIPRALVEKMVRARYFGMAMDTAQQIYYANLSLNYYNRDPASFELQPLMKDLQLEYSPYPWVEDSHMYNSFGHLNGYSSNYYTYQWSLSIATDLFSRFDREGLRNAEVAADYRREILGSAGTRPAHEAVRVFLDRPFSSAAYIDLLNSLN